MTKLEQLVAKCKGSVSVTANPHRKESLTIGQYLDKLIEGGCERVDFDLQDLEICYRTETIWEVDANWDNLAMSFQTFGSTMDVALDEMLFALSEVRGDRQVLSDDRWDGGKTGTQIMEDVPRMLEAEAARWLQAETDIRQAQPAWSSDGFPDREGRTMTDRINALTVFLTHDIRDDDIEGLVSAIRQLRNVGDVKTHVVEDPSMGATRWSERKRVIDAIAKTCNDVMKELR